MEVDDPPAVDQAFMLTLDVRTTFATIDHKVLLTHLQTTEWEDGSCLEWLWASLFVSSVVECSHRFKQLLLLPVDTFLWGSAGLRLVISLVRHEHEAFGWISEDTCIEVSLVCQWQTVLISISTDGAGAVYFIAQ